MNKEVIFKSITEEILRNLKARHQRNNGVLNMNDVLTEASYCLAVNNLSALKQLNKKTGNNIKSLPDNSINHLFNGMNRALENNLKADFKTEHSKIIKERYENIITDLNREELINNHYSGLFGLEGGNVL